MKIRNLKENCINIPKIIEKINEVIDQFNLLNAEVNNRAEGDDSVPTLDKYGIKLLEPISHIITRNSTGSPMGYVIVLKSGRRLCAYYDADCDIYDTKENLDKLIAELKNGVETNKEHSIEFPKESDTYEYFKDSGFSKPQIEVIKMYIRMIQFGNIE